MWDGATDCSWAWRAHALPSLSADHLDEEGLTQDLLTGFGHDARPLRGGAASWPAASPAVGDPVGATGGVRGLPRSVHAFAQAYLPTNILLRYLRSWRGVKWAIPVALGLVPACLFAASLATALIEGGRPRLAQPRRADLHLERDKVRLDGAVQRRPAVPESHHSRACLTVTLVACVCSV